LAREVRPGLRIIRRWATKTTDRSLNFFSSSRVNLYHHTERMANGGKSDSDIVDERFEHASEIGRRWRGETEGEV
jgi:uncharacterized protein YfaP (DUF2135 family)